jgi:hypothetical protein
MSIVIISGPAKSGKTAIANALRNNQIAHRNGALMVDETQTGEPAVLLEKMLNGINVPQPAPKDWATKLPWKKDSMVILVGKKADMLSAFEEMLPGFKSTFGPVYTITTGVAR